MYRTDYCAAHPVLLNRLSKVNTSCGLAQQIFIYYRGAEVCGVQHIFMSDWTAFVHFPDSYPIDVFHLSFNFLCLLLFQIIYLGGPRFHSSTGHPLKLPSTTKLVRLGHFPPVNQAGRHAGPLFYVYIFSLVLWSHLIPSESCSNTLSVDGSSSCRESQ